jgi:hypothetical protein
MRNTEGEQDWIEGEEEGEKIEFWRCGVKNL